MVVNKRKKKSRHRGSHTHSWGAMKKHRGAGHRGGRGRAGSGKRGDANKTSYWKDPYYFGKKGFIHHNVKNEISAVNLGYFEEKLNSLLEKNLIEQKGDLYVVDIQKLGFNKVLSSGIGKHKFKVIAQNFSAKVKEKLEKAGGELVEVKKEEKLVKKVDEKTVDNKVKDKAKEQPISGKPSNEQPKEEK